MLASCGLCHSQLFCNKHTANPILDQITIDLRTEVFTRILQPAQDSQPFIITQSAER